MDDKKKKEERKKEKIKYEVKKQQKIADEYERTSEELQKIIDNLASFVDDEGGEPLKVIKINVPSKKEKFFARVLKFLFSSIIIIALTGFFNWCSYDNVYLFILYSVSVSLFDMIFQGIIAKYFFKAILYSLGAVNLLPAIVSFVSFFFIYPFIEMKSIWLFILVIVLYMIIKKVMFRFVSDIWNNNKEKMKR